MLKLIFCALSLLSFVGCAEMGIKPHKPSLKSTLEIAKNNDTYNILIVKGNGPEMDHVLNNALMKCASTTFSMPRGNTVATFIREVFEQELMAAQKKSSKGKEIRVIINSMELETTKAETGEWTIDIDYVIDDKTTNIKNTIEFESKLSMLSACTHTAQIFEDTLADNFVELFKRLNKM